MEILEKANARKATQIAALEAGTDEIRRLREDKLLLASEIADLEDELETTRAALGAGMEETERLRAENAALQDRIRPLEQVRATAKAYLWFHRADTPAINAPSDILNDEMAADNLGDALAAALADDAPAPEEDWEAYKQDTGYRSPHENDIE